MSFIGSPLNTPMAGGMRFAGSTRGRSSMLFNGANYPSPFFDVAHTYLPPTMKQLFRWCRYYFLTNPLINATIFKLAQYPITDIMVESSSEALKTQWEKYLQGHLHYRAFQAEVGLDYYCLAGETTVTTEAGVKPIRDLVGQRVRVLSSGGVYREALFKSYGVQRLWEVHTDDGVIFATEEHSWPVHGPNGKEVRRTTKQLKGCSVPRVVAPRPPQNAEFWEGVRHGIIFGDGTLSNEGKQAHVLLYTKEKRVLARYFEQSPLCPGHYTITPHREDKYVGVYGLPPSYKNPPAADASASYWYGFNCGLFATDGSVDVRGDSTHTQKDPLILVEIAKRLPWLGLLGGKVREHRAWNTFTKQEEPMNYLSLKKQYLQPQDFIRPDQHARFTTNFEKTNYGQFVKVKKVVPTNRVEEVFCCEEPETHSFVIGNGMLTGNCYGNAFISISYPFRKILICPHCGHSNEARKLRRYWVFASLHFRLTCPKCSQIGNARVWDHYIKNPSGIRLMRWNPENIEVADNEYSGERYYFYTIPAPIKNDIVIGRKDIVESIPQGWIEAIREQKSLLFPQGGLFHFKRPSLAEENRGWGIPLLLPVLKDTFYLQIMKKAQEAILLEHIVPLRIIFPQAGSGTSDPYTSINLAEWREHVAAELARWRYDQNYIPIMPIPLGNQTVGGDGKALLLTGEITQWSDHIVTGMGVPREFVFGGLSYAGTNLSMRMMENFFIDYIGRHQDLIDWVIQEISIYLGWAKVNTRFKPFKMADDLQRRALEFQENQAGLLSDTSYLAGADRSAAEENKLRIKETAMKVNAAEKQQLAMAEVQGRVQVAMAKYTAEAQQVTQQAMMAPQAPGEPGGPEAAAGAGTPGGQEAGAPPPGMPASAPQPPTPGAAPPSPMDQAQSPLNAGQQLQQGSKTAVGVDLPSYAMAQAKMIASMDPQLQQIAVSNLQAQSPELADLVQQILKGLQKGQQRQAAGLGVDARPLPEQRAPTRDRASV